MFKNARDWRAFGEGTFAIGTWWVSPSAPPGTLRHQPLAPDRKRAPPARIFGVHIGNRNLTAVRKRSRLARVRGGHIRNRQLVGQHIGTLRYAARRPPRSSSETRAISAHFWSAHCSRSMDCSSKTRATRARFQSAHRIRPMTRLFIHTTLCTPWIPTYNVS